LKRIPYFIVLFLLSNCASNSTQLTVYEAADRAPAVEMSTSTYADFQAAITNFDLREASRLADEKSEIQFVQGLEQLRQGNFEVAVAVLQTVYKTTQDPWIKNHSFSTINDLWFYQSRWNNILSFNVNRDEDTPEYEELVLVRRYSTGAAEQYLFPDNKLVLPLKKSLSGSPVVKVKINGKTKKFWVDTHASPSVVASDLALKAGLKFNPEEVGQAGTATSKKVNIVPAIIEELQIGGLTIRNHPVIVIDKRDLEFKLLGIRVIKIDGIIGWNAIQNMRLTIDYEKNLLSIEKSVPADNPGRNLYWLEAPIVELQTANGSSLNFGLDTGANATSAFAGILPKINVTEFKTGHSMIGGAGGMEKVEDRIIPEISFRLGDRVLDFRNLYVHPAKDTDMLITRDGILGINIVEDRRLIIDAANGICRIE